MNSFKTDATAFLTSLISQRLRLDANGESKNPTAGNDARELDKYLKAYPLRSESQFASFWINNLDKIQNIIPGFRSGSARSKTEQFNKLTFRARRLDNRAASNHNNNFYAYSSNITIG